MQLAEKRKEAGLEVSSTPHRGNGAYFPWPRCCLSARLRIILGWTLPKKMSRRPCDPNLLMNFGK